MKGNKLKMNDDKTELISIGSKSKLKQVSTNTMFFQDCETEFSESVRNFGCSWMSLSMEMRLNQLCKVLYFQLRKISKIRYVSLLQTYKSTRTVRSQDSFLLVVPRFSLNTYGKNIVFLCLVQLLGIHSLYTSDRARAWSRSKEN